MNSQPTGNRLEKYHEIETRAFECKIRLLKSEVDAQTHIAKWRAELERKTMEQLHKAEQTMLNDLRSIVSERELEIDKIEEAGKGMEHDGDCCDENLLQHVIVRFEPDESFQILHDSSPQFGTLHIEDVTEAQMYRSLAGMCQNEEAGIYEISSIADSIPLASDLESHIDDDECYIHPLYNENDAHNEKRSTDSSTFVHKVHIDKETKTSEREILKGMTEQNDIAGSNDYRDLQKEDSNYCTQSQPIYSFAKLKRTPSVETIQLFGGDSIPQDSDKSEMEPILSTVYSRACNNGEIQSSNIDNLQDHSVVKRWKTFHRSEKHVMHSLADRKDENQYATPKLALAKLVGSQNSQNMDKGVLQLSSSERELNKSPELYQKDLDSCRLAIMSDGRFVLLCESIKCLMLHNINYQYVASMHIKWPKAICHATDNLALVVHMDDHNENILYVEAKSNYMNIVDGNKFGCKGRIFDIQFRDAKIYLGCNEGHLHVWNDELEEVSVVTIENEKLCFPCISLDYNLVSKTLYIVSSNGDLSVLERKDPFKTTCAKTQAFVVCCLGDKAYVLCREEKYNVVVEICPDGETIKKREVIRLAELYPTDMSISPKGEYLLLLHSDGMALFIEKYSIHRHS